MEKFIPYGRQNIDEDDIQAVVDVLRSRMITQGPVIEEFEKMMARYCGVRFAVAFNSGTSALHGAMYAAGVRPGEEVITSPITFVASANAALYVGAKPVFADMDINSYCIDIAKVEAAITSKTRAIVPVDYAGYPVDIKHLREIADRYHLVIIEDAAHALGAGRNGLPVGCEADMTMFSFHPVKHITTGEGGMIVTNNYEYYRRLKQFVSHGIAKDGKLVYESPGPWYYEMQDIGYNYRITDIQCALGLSQLKKLEKFLIERRRIAHFYDEAFKDIEEIKTPALANASDAHAYHLYPILLDRRIDRKHFFNYMRDHRILVQVHYLPVHLQPYYRSNFGYQDGDFPVAEDFYQREVSLPIYPGLGHEEQLDVIELVKKARDVSFPSANQI